MSKLGEKLSNRTAAPAAAVSAFRAALTSTRPHRDIVVPRLDLPARLFLLGTVDVEAIEAEIVKRTAELELDTVVNQDVIALRRAALTLARAAKEMPDPSALGPALKPLGTVEEWLGLDPEALVETYRMYNGLREESDPSYDELAPEDRAAIADAVVKKNETLLRYFGARKLARWLTTSGVLVPIYSTSMSSHGDSLPAS